MNYHLTHKGQKKRRFFSLNLPLLFIGAIVLFHFFFPMTLGNFASRVALPFWEVEIYLRELIQKAHFFFSSKQALSAEVLRLSFRLEEADRLLLDRDLLRDENALLLRQLGRGSEKPERVIGAVLVLPPRSPYDTAIIDIGAREGIEVGDRAISGSIVLGLVSKVYERTSIVEFFSTAGKKTPVQVLHADQTISVDAAGQGGGTFIATLPKEVLLDVGDAVVMPGLNPLLFANIVSIEGSPTDSFAVIRFKNPLPFSTIRFLEVERSVGEE